MPWLTTNYGKIAMPGSVRTREDRILMAGAKVSRWVGAWPDTPSPEALRVVKCDEEGKAVKLTEHEWASDTISIIGSPFLQEEAVTWFTVGLSHALRLAARFEGPVVVGKSGTPMEFLDSAQSVYAVCLQDDVTHERAAFRVCFDVVKGLKQRNVEADIYVTDALWPTDPPKLDPVTWEEHVESLRELNGMPRWEAERVARIAWWDTQPRLQKMEDWLREEFKRQAP